MDFRYKASFHNVHAKQETAKAILYHFEEFNESFWIPKSQIDDDSEVYEQEDYGTLVVSEWIVEQKGLL